MWLLPGAVALAVLLCPLPARACSAPEPSAAQGAWTRPCPAGGLEGPCSGLPRKRRAAPSFLDPLGGRAGRSPDLGALLPRKRRAAASLRGITLHLSDSENLLGNFAGGVKQGSTVQGLTTLSIDVRAGKAFGLPGGAVHASVLDIHGQPLTGPYLDNLQAANGNEGRDGARLWELWYDQDFDHGRDDVKIGQQSIDNEFIVSSDSGLFVNTMAGWPLLPSFDMYGGGPAYPLSSLGARLRARMTHGVTVLAGAFDDNPGGGRFAQNAQVLDPNGTNFNLNTGTLYIGELQYATAVAGLPGSYKLGAWYDTGLFPDEYLAADGLSQADPRSGGVPLLHHGDASVYGVVDQTVWRSPVRAARALNVFGRIMGAPDDRNLIDVAFNGGLTVNDPLPGRPDDQFGIDLGIGHVSGRAAELDRASGLPAQGVETLVELTYLAQVARWLALQPDLQYIVHPGGGLLDPADPRHLIRNELVAGVRAVVTF